ncbi:dihydrofolate reductase family protein [Pseudonocardia sp. RS11V-5]|uniref:dihydrofolate reductase family protein n=1 Tax=Pseudonocardia terrae TaxID=2905831 RepID=UPI001E2F7C93|nr:dihydrofolate reductase family protein [Pseudonocardia terrae]MCE3551700.1 dihydrofolate reductase family protein [Pseudonocardia terrae]
MGRIKVHEFTTLDGVIGAPMWTMDYGFTDQLGAEIGGFMTSCTAILLGRTTFQEFAPAWSGRTAEDDPGAPFFNESPKYVVSGTLQTADWNNSTIVGKYDPDTIRDLKARVDGDLYVSGSGTLVRALLADGLLDELHLFVYPLAVGEGPRLFPENGPRHGLSLAGCTGLDNGVVHLTYGPAAG